MTRLERFTAEANRPCWVVYPDGSFEEMGMVTYAALPPEQVRGTLVKFSAAEAVVAASKRWPR